MEYTKLKREYEMKNGKVDKNVVVLYHSNDNSIAYDVETDIYIINNKMVIGGRDSFDMIYEILSYELDFLGLEKFNQSSNQYYGQHGEWYEFWLNEINEKKEN